MILRLPIYVIRLKAVLYWLTGLDHQADKYFIFATIICAQALCTVANGIAVSAISPTIEVASALRCVCVCVGDACQANKWSNPLSSWEYS